VDLRRRQFDRAVTYASYWAGGVAGQRRGGIADGHQPQDRLAAVADREPDAQRREALALRLDRLGLAAMTLVAIVPAAVLALVQRSGRRPAPSTRHGTQRAGGIGAPQGAGSRS
jgi:hypothetical protein